MIILDTNVVSEPMRPQPDERILRWLSAQDASTLFLTVVTEAELRTGLAFLPEGRRRAKLVAALEAVLTQDFAGRVQPFEGEAAARAYAAVQAGRQEAGRPIAMADATIAAIARSRGTRVATRNVYDFGGTGVEVVNPRDQQRRPQAERLSVRHRWRLGRAQVRTAQRPGLHLAQVMEALARCCLCNKVSIDDRFSVMRLCGVAAKYRYRKIDEVGAVGVQIARFLPP
jgi:predicted nucleic acid-binding protein